MKPLVKYYLWIAALIVIGSCKENDEATAKNLEDRLETEELSGSFFITIFPKNTDPIDFSFEGVGESTADLADNIVSLSKGDDNSGFYIRASQVIGSLTDFNTVNCSLFISELPLESSQYALYELRGSFIFTLTSISAATSITKGGYSEDGEYFELYGDMMVDFIYDDNQLRIEFDADTESDGVYAEIPVTGHFVFDL
ncbi:MAG: hypothetical protein ABJF04_01655 [Reichenbachiella sp.]|uniref:hypothetical protein n=1 Tax=Reichenbachiella sp. TaxID=2184521 RepID=UPI0032663D0D